MLRITTVVFFVVLIFAFVTVASVNLGPGSGAPSAVSAVLGGFTQDTLAGCSGSCR